MERFPRDPVKPMEQANAVRIIYRVSQLDLVQLNCPCHQVPPLFRKFYCYLNSPEQVNTKKDVHALEKELLHVLIELRKAKPATDEKEEATFCTYFPDHAERYDDVEKRFDALCASIQVVYGQLLARLEQAKQADPGLDEEKLFAALVASEQWKCVLFRMRKLGTTAHDILVHHTALKNVLQLLSH